MLERAKNGFYNLIVDRLRTDDVEALRLSGFQVWNSIGDEDESIVVISSTTGNTMNIWLDDERDPNDPFIQRNNHAHGDEIWVKTATEAIEKLKTGQVKRISLDHDLGIQETGYDVLD